MKKIISVFLSLVVIMTMSSAVVFADDNAAQLSTDENASASLASESAELLSIDENAAVTLAGETASTYDEEDIPELGLKDVTKSGFTIYWSPVAVPGKNVAEYDVYDMGQDGDDMYYIDTVDGSITEFSCEAPIECWSIFSVLVTYTDGTQDVAAIGIVNTVPKAASTSKIKVSSMTNSSTTLGHSYSSSSTMATGIQYQLSKYSSSSTTNKYSTSTAKFSTSRNVGYKYRARLYYKNEMNGKKYYGAWSGYEYFDNPTVSGKAYSTKKIKLNIKKGTNVKSYKVYISTKKSSGYKLAKTVKVGSKSSYTTTIYKYGTSSLKRGKKYYTKVTPIMKNGKTSQISVKHYVTIP